MVGTGSMEIIDVLSDVNAATLVPAGPLSVSESVRIPSLTSTVSELQPVWEKYLLCDLVNYFNTKYRDELFSILYRNEFLQMLLRDVIDFVVKELQDSAEQFNIGISLEREDPEDPEQRIIFLIVCGKWKFRDFNERLDAMVKVWKYMESRKNEYLKNSPLDRSKIEEAYFLVSVFIGEEGDDCEVFPTR